MNTKLRRQDVQRLLQKTGGAPQAQSALRTRDRAGLQARTQGRAKRMSEAAATGYALTVGGNGYATLGQLSQPVSTTSATFEAWIQSSTKTAQGIFQLFGSANAPSPLISVANDQLTVAWAGTTFASQDVAPVTDGQWHHIAIVFDRGTLTVYKDGLPTADDFALTQGQTLSSGSGPQAASGDGAIGAFNGTLYDLRVWTTARKQAEIQAFMYLTLSGKEAGLSLLWNFPTASVGNLVNGTTGATSGNATVAQVSLPQQPPPLMVWMYPMLPSATAAVGPVMTSSALIYPFTGVAPDGSYIGQVQSVDLQNNTTNWTYDTLLNTPPDSDFTLFPQIASLTEADGVVYVAVAVGYIAGESIEFVYIYLHAIDADTGAKLWVEVIEPPPLETSSAAPVHAVDGVLYAGWSNYDITNYTPYAGGFMAFNSQGDILWDNYIPVNATTIFDSFTGAAVSGGIAVYGANFDLRPSGATAGTLLAVNATAGWNVWSVETGTRMSANPNVAGDVVYVGTDAGTLFAFNLHTGAQLWSYQADGQIVTTPAVQGTSVYVGTVGGTFFAIDTATGHLQWELATGNRITTDLLVQDGVAYFANSGVSAPILYAVDLSTAGADVITYDVPFGDLILFSSAGASGVVYFYGSQTIYAINMENIIHEFQVDTKLIVEDYDTSASPPTPTDTSYRVTITLFDPNKTPRGYQGVKLWATDTLSLTSDAVAYTIGPTQPVWLETDATGQVTFAVNAFDASGTPYVTVPAIQAWANFMQQQEAIVIYPDHENLANLATVQGSAPSNTERRATDTGPLYLNQAKGYDGQPMILSQYQQPAALNQIAQIITNTVGLRSPTSASAAGAERAARATLRDPATTKYLAYPETMPNVAYQADSTQATGRAYVSGQAPHWVSTFDATTGAPSFTQLTSDQAAQQIQDALDGAQGGLLKGIFTDIGDFFSHVVKGAEEIGKAIWHAVESGIEALIETVENVYHFVLTTVEDAIKVVVGFFKKVVADIKKVIQWLSWLFDWTDFVTTHNQIKQTVQTNVAALQTWINSQIKADLADVKAFFGRIEGDVDSSFESIIAKLQGKTFGNIRAQNNDTQQVFTQGGKNYHGPCMWLHHKTKENLKAATLAGPGGASPHKLYFAWVPNQIPGAEQSMADVFTTAFEGFLDAIVTAIAENFAEFPAALVTFGKQFAALFSNRKTFLQNALADLLGLIQTIADELINIASSIAQAFLLMLQAIINAIADYVTNPPAVDIPFVSSLYHAITGQPLSWFDLIAMVIAIPATIMFKVFESFSAASLPIGLNATGQVPQIFDWVNFFIMIVIGIVDPIVDISDYAPGMATFDLILNIYDQCFNSLLIVWPFSKWEPEDYIFWAIQWVPVVFSGYGIYLKESASKWATEWDEFLQPWGTCVFGLGMGAMSAIYADVISWAHYGGLSLAENIVAPIIYNAVEPLKLIKGSGEVIMAVIKVGSAVAYAIMNLVGAITSSSASSAAELAMPLAHDPARGQ